MYQRFNYKKQNVSASSFNIQKQFTYNKNFIIFHEKIEQTYLKSRLNDVQIRIYFTQVMLTELRPYVLYNEIYGYMVVSSSRNDDVRVLLCWEDEIIKCRLDKLRILHVIEYVNDDFRLKRYKKE